MSEIFFIDRTTQTSVSPYPAAGWNPFTQTSVEETAQSHPFIGWHLLPPKFTLATTLKKAYPTPNKPKRIRNTSLLAENIRWLPPQQAADYLGCSKALLDKDRVTGLHGIPFTRLGRHIRYDIADLDAFLERNKVMSAMTAASGNAGVAV